MPIENQNIVQNLKELKFLQDALLGKIDSINNLTKEEINDYYKSVANLGLLHLQTQLINQKENDDRIVQYYEKLKEKELKLIPQTDFGKFTKEYYQELAVLSEENHEFGKTIAKEENKDTIEYYQSVTNLSDRNHLFGFTIAEEENQDTTEYYQEKVKTLSDRNHLLGSVIAEEENQDTIEYYQNVTNLSDRNHLLGSVVAEEENQDTREYYNDVTDLSNRNHLLGSIVAEKESQDTREYYNDVTNLSNRNHLLGSVVAEEESQDTTEYYQNVTNLSDRNHLLGSVVANEENQDTTEYYQSVTNLSDRNHLLGSIIANRESQDTREYYNDINELSSQKALREKQQVANLHQDTTDYYKKVAKHAVKQKMPFKAALDRFKDPKFHADWGFHMDPSTFSFGGGVGIEYRGFQLDLSIQKYYGDLDARSKAWARRNKIKQRYTLDDLTDLGKKASSQVTPNGQMTDAQRSEYELGFIKPEAKEIEKYFGTESSKPVLASPYKTSILGADMNTGVKYSEKIDHVREVQLNEKTPLSNYVTETGASKVDVFDDSIIDSNKTLEEKTKHVRDKLIQSTVAPISLESKILPTGAISDKIVPVTNTSTKSAEEINQERSEKVNKLFSKYHADNSSKTSMANSGLLSDSMTFPKPGEEISTQNTLNGKSLASRSSYTFSGGVIHKGFSGLDGLKASTFGTPDNPTSKKLEAMLAEYKATAPGSYKFFIEKLHGRHTNGNYYVKNPIKSGLLRSDIPNRMLFPAYIENYNDSYDVNWNSENLYGRSEAVHIYQNTGRKLSISFFMVSDFSTEMLLAGVKAARDLMRKEAISKDPTLSKLYKKNPKSAMNQYGDSLSDEERLEELRKTLPDWGSGSMMYPTISNGKFVGFAPGKMSGTPEMLWSKLTFLAQCCYPWYRNDGKMKEQPFIRIRIGDFIDAIGKITAFNIDNYESFALDLNPSKVGAMPMGVTVTLSMDIVHEDEPSSEYYKFYHRKDFDIEGIYYIPDCLKTDSQTCDSALDPNAEDEALMYATVEELKTDVDGLAKQSGSLNQAGASQAVKKALTSSQNVQKIAAQQEILDGGTESIKYEKSAVPDIPAMPIASYQSIQDNTNVKLKKYGPTEKQFTGSASGGQ